MTRDECIEVVEANLRMDDTPRGKRLRRAWEAIKECLDSEDARDWWSTSTWYDHLCNRCGPDCRRMHPFRKDGRDG